MTSRKVLILNNLGTISNILEENGFTVNIQCELTTEQVKEILFEYDVIVVGDEHSICKEVIDAGKKLKVIGRLGVGYDNVDVSYAKSKNVAVINCPTGNIISTAELTCAMILALARKIPQATMALKSEVWNRPFFMGEELSGKTLAIIGFGKIGKEVAKRMKAFDMHLIGFDPIASELDFEKHSVEKVPLEELWTQADYITLHTPLNDHTKHLINEANLQKCKKGVKIVNIARGACVNANDLLQNLVSSHVSGAALDVFEIEPLTDWTLLKHPNVIATPHCGACTKEAYQRVAQEMASQILDFMNGKPVHGLL